jgi:hypothetical protein
VLELVKWSLILPLAAILLGLTARGIASIFQSVFKTTVPGISADRGEAVFIPRSHAEIARLRHRRHVH